MYYRGHSACEFTAAENTRRAEKALNQRGSISDVQHKERFLRCHCFDLDPVSFITYSEAELVVDSELSL